MVEMVIPPQALEANGQGPAPPSDAFGFGRNWQRYVATYLDSEREQIAAQSLTDLLQVNLDGLTFIDIGSGSGLFSLCACRAGAGRVISLDIDSESVAATRLLRSRAGSPANWQVSHRSILDDDVVEQLPPADVVYSWGVLHHTGDMYHALRNAAAIVAPGGLLAVAIYNRISSGWLDSNRWLVVKRTYNHAPRWAQIAMELAFQGYWLLGRLRSCANPVRVAREYKQSRGMAVRTDLIDWLGGYPYEFATADEIIDFCGRHCGLTLERVVPVPTPASDPGNNQFLFRRPA